jgi:hypothetical protein
VVINDTLYHRTLDGVLLKCLRKEEARIAMGEAHERMCGAHQSTHKLGIAIECIGQQCSRIVLSIIEVVKHVRDLERYKQHLPP